MPPDLPGAIAFLFKFSSFFNADLSAVSYEGCGEKSYPFTLPVVSMVLAVALLVLHGTIEWLKKRQQRQEDVNSIGFCADRPLAEGAKVVHGSRGQGVVVTIDVAEKRGKPVIVQFESGEVHHYSLQSAAKLKVVPPGSRKLSVAQGFIATLLMALYPLIAKNCLRFLHCETSATGELLLLSGPATRVSFVGGRAVTETVLMRCAQSLSHRRSHSRHLREASRTHLCTVPSPIVPSLLPSGVRKRTLSGRMLAGAGPESTSLWECSRSASCSCLSSACRSFRLCTFTGDCEPRSPSRQTTVAT
jgi:hypothetical protein